MAESAHLPDRDWFRPVLDAVGSAVLVEADERILYANPAYAALLEYDSPQQLMGRHISSIIADVDRSRLSGYSQARAKLGRAPSSVPFVAQCKDGSGRELHATVSSARCGDACYIISIVSPVVSTDQEDPLPLSPREKIVFDLLTRGKRPKEIAYLLQISVKTVGTLRGRMMKKLGLNETWDLFRFAAERAVREPRRLDVVSALGALGEPPEQSFDALAEIAARTLAAPVAFLSIVGRDRDYYPGTFGFPAEVAEPRQLSGETFCHHALIASGPLVVPDTHAHPLYSQVPSVKTFGVGAYLGIPLVIRGAVVGALCVVDFEARDWSENDVSLLEQLARYASTEIELRVPRPADEPSL